MEKVMAILCKEEENNSISLTFLFHLQRKYSNALQNSCGNQEWEQEIHQKYAQLQLLFTYLNCFPVNIKRGVTPEMNNGLENKQEVGHRTEFQEYTHLCSNKRG